MTAQVAADLRAAAELLKRDGWVQGANYHAAGGRCAWGGIVAAVADRTHLAHFDRAEMNRALDRAGDAVEAVVGELVTIWNDQPGRSADEVIAALLAAADATERDAT